MSDEVIIKDSQLMPTKELLRQQRKRDYEAAKRRRREERQMAKQQLAHERQLNQQQRDQELWSSLKRASTLEEDPS